jgi:hypothetical protein
MSDQADDVARLVADKLARRCWSVTRDDLRQEAEAAALHARKNYDPEKGDLRGYLYRSVARHLTNYMWEAGSPVSYKHRRSELRAAHAVSTDAAAHIPVGDDVDDGVRHARWRVKVQSRMVTLAEIEGEANGFDPELVTPVLLEDATPLAVSKVKAVTLKTVLTAVEMVQTAMQADPIMLKLWGELTGGTRRTKVRTYTDNEDDDYVEVDDVEA